MSISQREDERRLFEQFVIAGLNPDKLEPVTASAECGSRNAQQLPPITDICIIFPSLGETPPEDFTMIETTTLGYPADLNHGSLRIPSCFLCYRRGYRKPPLLDIGVLDEGRGDRPMVDTHLVTQTPFGRSANVNNASQAIYLTYRRAPPANPPSAFVVTDICVILTNKGEIPPHTFYKIPKNLNKGMVGSDIYICYKKSQGFSNRLIYKPSVLDYFPRREQHSEEEEQLAANVPIFCLPMGATIECLNAKYLPQDKSFNTFVLTDVAGNKLYGSSVTFYEKYTHELTEEQREQLNITIGGEGGENEEKGGAVVDDTGSNSDPADEIAFYTNMSICLISRFPYFNSFKRFLFFLHRIASSPNPHSVPIERYISHLLYEVSVPTPRRPRVVMRLGAENITFECTDDSQLPLNGAQLSDALKTMGCDNLMYLMTLALLEQKILVHSLRPWMLTAVSESVRALMFPFHWQCPYVPQCPLPLAYVLHSPVPFIAGVDSRYFELYEDPPHDVTCFDLDTQTVSASDVRREIKLTLLPRKAVKQLRQALEDISRKMGKQDFETKHRDSQYVPVDQEFLIHKKKKEIEMEIQEAFLKFMIALMRGYQSFLRPIKTAPVSAAAKDIENLFDTSGFLKSRDKQASEFFEKLVKTQLFASFIEERSFVSDKNAYNAFFDDCIEKIDNTDIGDVSLLELDSSLNGGTAVFITPPEPSEESQPSSHTYDSFPRQLDPALFQLDLLDLARTADGSSHAVPVMKDVARCAAVRTKPEIRSSLMAATNAVKTSPIQWPKTLLFYAYSLWFLQLPSLLALAPNKRKILRLAFHILDRLESTDVFPLDQVPYRILIELCGQCQEPALAVKVLQAMQRAGLEQNAVTYGIYHRAVLDAEWPTPTRQNAIVMWNRLRMVVYGTAVLRRLINAGPICGSQPGNTTDSLPRSETDNTNAEAETTVSAKQHAHRPSDTHSISDPGYASDRHDDAKELDLQTKDFVIESYELDNKPTDPLCPSAERPSTPSATITSTPQLSFIDPLNSSTVNEHKLHNVSKVTMSPSRAKFLDEHSKTPFASDVTPKTEAKPSSKTGWLKGFSNSPLMRILKNGPFESPRPVDSPNSDAPAPAITVSPSLRSLVSQVRQGYDDVKEGVSLLVSEVTKLNLNRSYGLTGSGLLYLDEHPSIETGPVDPFDPAFQLDTGKSGAILTESWWLKEVCLQLRRNRMRESRGSTGEQETQVEETENGELEVRLSTATKCPDCKMIVYDEEIMAGWKIDDQNLNTICPHCRREENEERKGDSLGETRPRKGIFVPQLTVESEWRVVSRSSWYLPGGLEPNSESDTPLPTMHSSPSLQVAFISPLVLRRELETLLANDIDVFKDASIRHTNPTVFWNLVYYLRRLSLPTHLTSFIAESHHVRCVYDRPLEHSPELMPLYFMNPLHNELSERKNARQQKTWDGVVTSIAQNQLFKAIQTIVNECRQVQPGGGVSLGPHFPLFRDLQFTAIDQFGRSLLKDSLDTQYAQEIPKLPPKIAQLLPYQDWPQSDLTRACRKVFWPLDLM